MAKEKISMVYDLKQNGNEDSTAFGKWYPRAVRRDTLSLRGLADHITDHGSIYTRDVVLGVLTKFTSCLTELVSQGTGVKLDGLGTFYPTLEAHGAESPVGYDANAYVKGVHIRFLPESAALDNITSYASAAERNPATNDPYSAWHVDSENPTYIALPWVNNTTGNLQNGAEFNSEDNTYSWMAPRVQLSFQPYLLYIRRLGVRRLAALRR